MTAYWCEYAYVGGSVAAGVSIDIVDGRFGQVTADTMPRGGATRLAGLSLAGFANAHSHAFHRALRGKSQGGEGSFWTWRDTMYGVAGRLTPDTYHELATATFAEMALAGITSVGEFHYLHHRPDGGTYDDPNAMGEAVMEAAERAGIRITLLDTLYLHGGLDGDDGYQPPNLLQRRFSDGTVDAWTDRVENLDNSDRRRIGAAIHSVRAVDPAGIRTVARWAADRDAPLHAHVSEQPAENDACRTQHGTTPIGLLDDCGALSDAFTAVHATHLTDADIDRLAAAGATVCMCPTTERDLGDGVGPTDRFADRGIGMSLGTDSHASIDLLAEARAMELNQRLVSLRRGVHSAANLLASATTVGHTSLGWTDAGAIAEGWRADLVTVALDSVRTAGSTGVDAAETVCFAATAADVRHVLVDGRVVVADGAHTSVDVPTRLATTISAITP